MIQLFASACIAAPADLVWKHLAKLDDIQLWSEAVIHASCPPDRAHGVGAQRSCQLVGNRLIQERWIAWDEGHSFQYEGFGIPLMRRTTNRWSVIPYGDQSLLISEAELELKGGVLGRLLEPLLAPVMQRIAPNALAGFKYLVEHGHPYDGKFSELPRVTATCY